MDLAIFLSVASGAANEIDLAGGLSLQPYGQLSPSYLRFDDGIDGNR
jgi:hypothetical protein